MESNQDQAFNTIHILDDTAATSSRTGCAIFNGGINVAKNVYACEAELSVLKSNKAKISDCLSVQHNIYTDGAILPLTSCSKAQLGCPDKKWNSIDTVSANVQQLCTVNSTNKNSSIENLHLITTTTNISDTATGTATYDIYLDSAINIVNLTSTHHVGRMVIIRIPAPDIGSNNDYKKIIFKQNLGLDIKWLYNTTDHMTISNDSQILDLINIGEQWKVVDYNSNTSEVINNVKDTQTDFDTSLNAIDAKLDVLVEYNNFLSATDTSANSLLDFIDETESIKSDITRIDTSIGTMTGTITSLNTLLASTITELSEHKTSVLSDLTDISLGLAVTNNTTVVFKDVVNTTFQNINSSLLLYDSKISGIALKASEITLSNKRTKEHVDMVDKKLCDHIANTDSKLNFMNDKMSHINEKLNVILERLGLC